LFLPQDLATPASALFRAEHEKGSGQKKTLFWGKGETQVGEYAVL